YFITALNSTNLVLKEDSVNYIFKRQDLAPSSLLPDYDFNESSLSITSLARGLLGLTVLVFFTFLMSSRRKKINWPLVFKGIFIQILFALGILKVPFIRRGFEWISSKFVIVLDFTKQGSEFLFGGLITDTNS